MLHRNVSRLLIARLYWTEMSRRPHSPITGSACPAPLLATSTSLNFGIFDPIYLWKKVCLCWCTKSDWKAQWFEKCMGDRPSRFLFSEIQICLKILPWCQPWEVSSRCPIYWWPGSQIQEEYGRWAGQPEGRGWVHGARVREGEGTSGVVKTCSKVFSTEGTIGAVVVVVKMWKGLLIRGWPEGAGSIRQEGLASPNLSFCISHISSNASMIQNIY